MSNPYEIGLDLTNSNRIIGNPYALVEGISQEELARVNYELSLWKFYAGDQWNYKRPEGEPQNTINYVARFVDKGVSFLMGKGFTINVEKNAEDIIKPFLDEVLDDNERFQLGIEVAQSGGVTGNAWVKVALEQYDKEKEPFMYELYPKGRIRLIVLPSYACFPVWSNHDKERLESIKIMYPINIPGKDGKPEQVWYREDITTSSITEYLNGQITRTRDNDLGIVNVVRFKNLVVANSSFGKSDIKDLVALNKEFNEKTTDVSDIINYHASPITLVFGAKTNNLEKGARKIWGGLPQNAKVENLELKTDLGASMNYLSFIRDRMFEIASMPSDALGAETNVSNTSGIALHIKNQPLIDTNNVKRATYETGWQEVCRLILRIADTYELDGFDYEGFRKLKPKEKWFYDIDYPDPLPKDELIQMQLITTRIANQLMTRIDALKELGEYDAVNKLEEIKAEFIEFQNLMFEGSNTDTTEDNEDINLGGMNRDSADLQGHTGRNHSKDDSGVE